MYPGRQDIYKAVIRRMVAQALEEKESRFRADHGGDTDAQLLAYLQSCARELGHTPWPKEIVGWSLIRERFASWESAVQKAGLPKPWTAKTPSTFLLVIEETQRQQEVYRAKKKAKKPLAQQKVT